MKKNIFVFILPLMMVSMSSFAQTDNSSKLAFQLSYGFGSSTVLKNGISSSLRTSSTELLGIYQLNDNIGIGTGFSLLGLNGNSFDEFGNFNQTRGIFRIPVLLTSNQNITEKTHLSMQGGVFASNILEDSYEYLDKIETTKFDKWTLGVQSRIGLSYDIRTFASLGFGYNLQYNFSEFGSRQESVNSRMSSNTFEINLKFKI